MSKTIHNAGMTGKRAVKVVISLFCYSGSWLWHRLQRMAGREVPGTCVALYYHAVTAEHRARFAGQMNQLIRYARPIKSENRKPLEAGIHHAVIIFHDAFVSVCDNALPELAQRRIPSTLFVPSGYLGQRQGWIKDEAHSDYMEIVVDADRLRSLDSDLVSVGSHTVKHADLSMLSEQEASEELKRSKIELETILGRPVGLFAFPYGGFSTALAELSKQMGYERVFTIRPELAFSEPGEYVTGSCLAAPTDWKLEFRLKLLGAYHWSPPVHRFRHRVVLALRKLVFATRQGRLIATATCSRLSTKGKVGNFPDSHRRD